MNLSMAISLATAVKMKSLARLKYQTKNLAYKMFINEIDFHRLLHAILKVVFSFCSGVLCGKLVDFNRRM